MILPHDSGYRPYGIHADPLYKTYKIFYFSILAFLWFLVNKCRIICVLNYKFDGLSFVVVHKSNDTFLYKSTKILETIVNPLYFYPTFLYNE